MTKSQKLQVAIDEYQEKNHLPFSEWNNDNPNKRVIIALAKETYDNYVGFIKKLNIDDDPKEALEFGDEIGTMLYHYLPKLFKGKFHSSHHFPVTKRA